MQKKTITASPLFWEEEDAASLLNAIFFNGSRQVAANFSSLLADPNLRSLPFFFLLSFQEGDVLELCQVNDIRQGKLPQVRSGEKAASGQRRDKKRKPQRLFLLFFLKNEASYA